jgi:hypothetical protein
VLVLAQNIFTKLHAGAAKGLKEGFDAVFVFHHVVIAIDIERIKIVLVQIFGVMLSLLVSPPKEAGNEEDKRRKHGRDDIDANVAAEFLDHTTVTKTGDFRITPCMATTNCPSRS